MAIHATFSPVLIRPSGPLSQQLRRHCLAVTWPCRVLKRGAPFMHEPGHWKSRVHASAFHKRTHQWLQVMILDGFCPFVTGGVSLGGIPHRGSMGTILQRKDHATVPDLRDRDATPWKAEGPLRSLQGREAGAVPPSIHSAGRSWGRSVSGVSLTRLRHPDSRRHSAGGCWEGVLQAQFPAPATSSLSKGDFPRRCG